MEKIVQTAGKMQLGDFAPEFAHYNDDVLFGENWNNQDIDLKTRCIVTMVALMSSGITDSSLIYHLENAKAHGVTKAEAAAIITQFRDFLSPLSIFQLPSTRLYGQSSHTNPHAYRRLCLRYCSNRKLKNL